MRRIGNRSRKLKPFTYRRKHLTKEVAIRANIDETQANQVISIVLDTIRNTLKVAKRVVIKRFGVFTARHRYMFTEAKALRRIVNPDEEHKLYDYGSRLGRKVLRLYSEGRKKKARYFELNLFLYLRHKPQTRKWLRSHGYLPDFKGLDYDDFPDMLAQEYRKKQRHGLIKPYRMG